MSRLAGAATLGVAAITIAPVPAPAQSDGVWRDGAQVYSHVCGYCHESGVGPVLKGRGLPAEAFITTARQGMIEMPAFRHAEIDDTALRSVADYLAASKPDPAKPAQAN